MYYQTMTFGIQRYSCMIRCSFTKALQDSMHDFWQQVLINKVFMATNYRINKYITWRYRQFWKSACIWWLSIFVNFLMTKTGLTKPYNYHDRFWLATRMFAKVIKSCSVHTITVRVARYSQNEEKYRYCIEI